MKNFTYITQYTQVDKLGLAYRFYSGVVSLPHANGVIDELLAAFFGLEALGHGRDVALHVLNDRVHVVEVFILDHALEWASQVRVLVSPLREVFDGAPAWSVMIIPLVVARDVAAHLLNFKVVETAFNFGDFSHLGGTVLIHISSPVALHAGNRLSLSTILDEINDAALLRKVLEEGLSLTLLERELGFGFGVNLGEVHVDGDGLGDVGEDEGGGEDSECAHF